MRGQGEEGLFSSPALHPMTVAGNWPATALLPFDHLTERRLYASTERHRKQPHAPGPSSSGASPRVAGPAQAPSPPPPPALRQGQVATRRRSARRSRRGRPRPGSTASRGLNLSHPLPLSGPRITSPLCSRGTCLPGDAKSGNLRAPIATGRAVATPNGSIPGLAGSINFVPHSPQ